MSDRGTAFALPVQTQLEFDAPAPRRQRAARKAPLVRCGQCGRNHRTWNPRKVCNLCVRESFSARHEELAAEVRELERRLAAPTPAERAQDRDRFAVIHARWLARQSLDHPWRVAAAGGEA